MANLEQVAAQVSPRTRSAAAFAILVAAVSLGGLLTYKVSGALGALATAHQTGAISPKTGIVSTVGLSAWAAPLAASVDYFSWVLVALFFGVLIGAAVKVLVPQRWLVTSVGSPGFRGHLWAAVTGAPLMLCSCCVTPVFEGVYARTRRLGPSLGLMFAAPSLNPVALTLTFMLFPAQVAVGRLVGAVCLVLFGAATLGRLLERVPSEQQVCEPPPRHERPSDVARAFASAVGDTTVKLIPAIVLGVVASAVLAQALPFGAASAGSVIGVVLVVAALAVVIALPTFGEIPIGVALLAAGVSEGAVLALLLAGPAINAPSLFALGKAVSSRVAVATAIAVFLFAAAGGLGLAALGP